jgi:hypothetical protein
MNTRYVTLILSFTTVVLVGCGTAPSSTANSPSAAVSPVPSPSPSPSPTPAKTLYVLAPETGSKVSGTVQVDTGSDSATLTATVGGLQRGRTYIVDADPLPCMLFVGGPSQSFAKPLKVDAAGNGKVVWTVPNGMDGNVSVQVLTSRGTFAVVACADLDA